MKMVKVYLDGWRRMLVVRTTSRGGTVLLGPTASLRTVSLNKLRLADAHMEEVEFDKRWVRAHIKVWRKAARAAGRQYAASAVRQVMEG